MYELGVLKDAEDNQMKDFYEGYEDYGLKKNKKQNILKDVNEGNFKKFQEKSRYLHNVKRLTCVRGKAVHLQNPNRQSFDAVAEVKKGADDIDKFYIYCIKNSVMTDQPDYVFKLSLKMAKVAVYGPNQQYIQCSARRGLLL